MLTYRPDHFEQTFTLHNGARLWAWLQTEDNVAQMETASFLRRPAVEPLSPGLKRDFADQVHTLKARQMIGHMVRQILEARGYQLKRANVRISQKDNVFAFGSSYVRG